MTLRALQALTRTAIVANENFFSHAIEVLRRGDGIAKRCFRLSANGAACARPPLDWRRHAAPRRPDSDHPRQGCVCPATTRPAQLNYFCRDFQKELQFTLLASNDGRSVTSFFYHRPSRFAGVVLALLSLLSVGPRLSGQDLSDVHLAEVEPSPVVAPEQSTDSTADMNPALPVAANDRDTESSPVTSIDSAVPRRFHYLLRLNVRSVYDDNINLSDTNRISDIYTTIEPAIMVGFGDIDARTDNYIRLDYLPSVFFYADESENNAVQHVARVEGQYRTERLIVNFSQMAQIMDGVDVQTTDNTGSLDQHVNLDVAGRSKFSIYTTHFNAAYYVTGKTSLSAGADYTSTDYSSLISSETFSANLFVNYDYSPKLVVGVGGTAGSIRVDAPNPDQTFEQANVRASYQATGKIDFVGTAGVEFRHFDGDARDEYTTPVYEIRMNYVPFDGTKIFIAASRRNLNSAVLAAQNYAVTDISAGIQQRLFQRVFLGFNAGYENSDYYSTVGAPGPERGDDYFFVRPSVAVKVTRYLTVGAFYLHRKNSSSFDEFSFQNNQVGLHGMLEF
jgi:putative beta-barrel porin BBP2